MTTFDAFANDRTMPMPEVAQRVEARRRPLDGDAQRRWGRLVALAQLMDNRWEIPGTGIRVGLDALIGLIPGAGDAITTGIQGYIIYESWKLGATRQQMTRMFGNVAIDFAVGLIPGIGDLADVAFKANVRNLRIMGIECGGKGSTIHSKPSDRPSY